MADFAKNNYIDDDFEDIPTIDDFIEEDYPSTRRRGSLLDDDLDADFYDDYDSFDDVGYNKGPNLDSVISDHGEIDDFFDDEF